MPAATQVLTSFLGGEISEFAQGRYDRPDYRTSMRVCFNGFPLEIGAWTRRPGTRHAGYTRNGRAGRVLKFDFEQAASYTLEFTDGWMRFRSGFSLATTNDSVGVTAVSSANPAVVEVSSAVLWSTGNTVFFPGASTPGLESRQFTITVVDSTHFSIADAITGDAIDGSTLGSLVAGSSAARIQELQTIYVGGSWSNVRAVQAEKTSIVLASGLAPQALTVETLPSVGLNAVFAISQAVFRDGPYLDPLTNGAQLTPNQVSGIVQLEISFPLWSSTQAYASGTYVTYSGDNYISLQDGNVNNTPVSSPAYWEMASANGAINGGSGFSNADVGRLIRLFSEPAPWSGATNYGVGNLVSYNPDGQPGSTTYWSSLVNSNTGSTPGTDITKWSLVTTQGAALWTWGKIASLVNFISGNITGVSHIGNMTAGSGLPSAFDGVSGKIEAACAVYSLGSGGFGSELSAICFVGQDYSGTAATSYPIASATVFPSVDIALFNFSVHMVTNQQVNFTTNIYLFGSNTAPAAWNSGTILAQRQFDDTNVFPGSINSNVSYLYAPITLQSNDTTTAYKYVWVAITVGAVSTSFRWSAAQIAIAVSQVEFVSAASATANAFGINVEILGPSLLYSSIIRTWRLGVYSNATGWPTCGCYDGGRLFLGGAVPNRWDASVSNGLSGSAIDFAPTDSYGNVAASSAMAYTFNSDSVNPILWMVPELQGVIMGTQGGEWLVQAPSSGPLSPTNVSARRVTKIGCDDVEPRRTEHTTVFVKRYGRKLMEYFADVFSGKYSAPNLADKAQHIASSGIAELAYTEAVTPIIWGRTGDNGLFGISYKRDNLSSAQGPMFYGWHPHELGSGRTVESICSGPSTGGDLDTLTLVTNDGSIRHVEVLTDVPGESRDLADSWFLDDAVNPTSVTVGISSATFSGLWHLEGKTVQIFAAGLDLGDPGEGNPVSDFVVSAGSVTVSYGDDISAGPGRGLFTRSFATALDLSQVVIGFTYRSKGQIVRLIAQADTGARNGPALGAPSRAHRAALKLVNAKGLSIGGTFETLYPCLFKASVTSARDLPVLSTFTGIFYDQLAADFSYDDSLCWQVSRPFPCTITAVAQNLRTEDM